jgi:hypothetical protein
MSNLFDLAPLLAQGSSIRRADVVGFTEQGLVQVQPQGFSQPLECQVLNPEASGAILSQGDEVLVWLGDGQRDSVEAGVILGHVGPHAGVPQSVADADQFAARPKSLVIETQGDLVLRNGQARIKLGAQGDVEIVCTSFATRSQRLLRLLAPLIKLN